VVKCGMQVVECGGMTHALGYRGVECGVWVTGRRV
jgi:hypothetical protein